MPFEECIGIFQVNQDGKGIPGRGQWEQSLAGIPLWPMYTGWGRMLGHLTRWLKVRVRWDTQAMLTGWHYSL